ncbi:Chemotaxis protein methyltransferase CheR [Chitinispirillum alkaliphilum]|nr:Chemotaxis protein methyltransferase CheR [Chitinispirillum alkaliphilum]
MQNGNKSECTVFLKEMLPKMNMRYEGYRKVRKRVCKRISRRIEELGLNNFNHYLRYIQTNPEEVRMLDSVLRITITRFFRDWKIFESLSDYIFPEFIKRSHSQGNPRIDIWSAGCAAGQEPYTVWMIYDQCRKALGTNTPELKIVATDIDPRQIKRAKEGRFKSSELKELPDQFREHYFTKSSRVEEYYINRTVIENVEFCSQDIRQELPNGKFDLILCRNLVFTYFNENFQREITSRIVNKLNPGGYLVVGSHESVPDNSQRFLITDLDRRIYKKASSAQPG